METGCKVIGSSPRPRTTPNKLKQPSSGNIPITTSRSTVQEHAGFHGFPLRTQEHQKLPLTAYYSKQVEAALFRQYTNHNKQINSARARWLSWLPSQNSGTLMGETSIEPRTEVRRYTQSNSSGKPSTTQAKVS